MSPGGCPIQIPRLYPVTESAKGLPKPDFARFAGVEFPVRAGISTVALRADESQAGDPDADR